MASVAQLQWRCRRGMKELDLMLLAYLTRVYPAAPLAEQQAFEQLLSIENDMLIYGYLVGRVTPPDAVTMALVARIAAAFFEGNAANPV